MRLRQVVQTILRRRRIDEKGMSYRDIVWENAMEAYESSPDPVVDITPYIQARLDAAKEELLLKAHRTKRERERRRKERRRRFAVLAASVAGMMATVAGASAVTGVDIGFAPLDRLLGTLEERGFGEPRYPGQPSPQDRRAGSSPGVTVEVRQSASAQSRVITSYLSETKLVCFVEGAIETGESVELRGGGGCTPPGRVFEHLLRDTAYVGGASMEADGTLQVSGYTTADVDGVRLNGPFGEMEAVLSETWNPLPSEGIGIRMFLAVDVVEVGTTGLMAETLDRGTRLDAYRITVLLDGDWRPLTGGSPRL
jgi:hypothetical protein